MLVKAKWLDLLLFMHKKHSLLGDDFVISFKEQKFLKSVQFYKVMNDFVKLGWIRVLEMNKGIIKKKQYSLTRKGFYLVEDVFVEMRKLDEARE
jgi:DNA-binding PadR family transcriptional regulator